jgi:hypothetical protein
MNNRLRAINGCKNEKSAMTILRRFFRLVTIQKIQLIVSRTLMKVFRFIRFKPITAFFKGV